MSTFKIDALELTTGDSNATFPMYVQMNNGGSLMALHTYEAIKLRDALIEKFPIDDKPQSLWEDE